MRVRVPWSGSSRRACAGSKVRSAVMSLLACTLALSSTARPSSTKASSITGSSKKAGHPREGRSTAAELTAKEEKAPNPTRVFMLGRPLLRLLHPSASRLRAGPAMASRESRAWKGAEWRKWRAGGRAVPRK